VTTQAWQPIETAPKDGCTRLFWDGEYVTVGMWSERCGMFLCTELGDIGHPNWKPIAWMPLPEPPQ
jgi:hypothetical protein